MLFSQQKRPLSSLPGAHARISNLCMVQNVLRAKYARNEQILGFIKILGSGDYWDYGHRNISMAHSIFIGLYFPIYTIKPQAPAPIQGVSFITRWKGRQCVRREPPD